MGRVGSCFDNPAAEAFFSSLEWEVLSLHEISNTGQAQAVALDWCYGFYNHDRRHSSAVMMSPINYREHRSPRSGSRIEKPSTIRGDHRVATCLSMPIEVSVALAEASLNRTAVTFMAAMESLLPERRATRGTSARGGGRVQSLSASGVEADPLR